MPLVACNGEGGGGVLIAVAVVLVLALLGLVRFLDLLTPDQLLPK
jgi:hypothetical protein